MLKDVKCIIFDLDGTLIDSMWLWKQIDIDYLAQFGISLPESLQDEIEGKSFTETALYFKERFNLEDEIETIMSVWNQMAGVYYMEKVTLKPHVKTFLEQLRTSGIKLGIATSNSKELVTRIVERFDLNHYFSSIRTSCEVGNGKPSPDVYLKVAEDLEVEPSDCLVFEDVINGVKAGQSAGMKVCVIYDEFSVKVKTELEDLADYYIDDYSFVLV
jgi:HAD superfamily hydrolase (TIGR01509 family)